MNLQVLVSTMHQTDHSLLDRMNINSDAIIVNQCDRNEIEEFKYKGNNIKFMSFAERGVGISRNTALMRATADICLMADDDMVYVDNYEKIVIEAFKKNPKADMIMFNVPIKKNNGETIIKVLKDSRVRFYNALKYGTVNIAFKRESVLKSNIYFSLLFGGGTRYGAGEDTLFIVESLKKGLKIYSSTKIIANIEEGSSTWFKGYNEQFFFDRGALFEAIGGTPLSFLLMIQFLLRKRELYSEYLTAKVALAEMLKGRRHYLKS